MGADHVSTESVQVPDLQIYPRVEHAVTESPAASQRTDITPSARRLVMFALLAGVAMTSLDSAIANIALPTIANDLGARESATVWVVNAFQLGTALCLLPAAALGEIRGLKGTYGSGLIAFGLASLGCALSTTLDALVLFRLLQGAAGAFTAAIAPAIIRRIQAPDKMAGGLALVALTVAFSGAAGPSVAAAILSVARWPWLFLVNVPICAIAALAFFRFGPPNEPQPRRFDRGGALLSALALGLLVVGVDTLGVDAGIAAAEILCGLATFAALVAHQSRRSDPLVPLDLLRIPLFSLSLVTSVCSYAAQILAYVSLPFLFQSVQHRSAVETGLLVTPWPLLVMVAAPIAGKLTAKHPAALLGSLGLAALAIGLALLAAMPASPSRLDIAWRMALCGVGFGFFQTPNNTTLMTAGPVRRSGAAGGMLALARISGWCLGSALVVVVFAMVQERATLACLQLACGFATFGALVSVSRFGARPARSGA
jgi:DHA2 family multidrug resistance protein-like MFS transporter